MAPGMLVNLVVASGVVAGFACNFGLGPALASASDGASVDLKAFRELARTTRRSGCVDEQALYLIDRAYVVYWFQGSCLDAGGGIRLYGTNPDQLICSAQQTIAGSAQRCSSESDLPLFRAVLEHILGEPSDTLPGHSIEHVRWRPWWRFW